MNPEQQKGVAVLLNAYLRKFVNDYLSDNETTLSEKLETFFTDVQRHSGISHSFGADGAQLELVKNWRNAKSTALAVPTLYYLLSLSEARDLAAKILSEVFTDTEVEAINALVHATGDHAKPPRNFEVMRRTRWNLEPETIWIPGGTFLMGTYDEFDRDSFESPDHRVTIHSAFGIGRYPVTLKEYGYFVTDTLRKPKPLSFWNDDLFWEESGDLSWANPGFPQSGDHPVVGVSYEDAVAYCRWLSKNIGRKYRLPSESEWEYCCRAGTTTAFWWGDDMIHENAQFQKTRAYRQEPVSDSFEQGTAPVKSFKPNPWGLYQMHGNVWEWCADPWTDDYYYAPPHGGVRQKGDHGRAIIRGGCWLSIPSKLRSAKRDWASRSHASNTIGFRVACDLA